GPNQRHLNFGLWADQGAQLADHVFWPEAREQAAVELHAHLAWNDVDLQAAADDRRVDRVVQSRVEAAIHRTELCQRRIGPRRVEKRGEPGFQWLVEGIAHAFQLLRDRGREVDRQAALVEPGKQLAELGHGAAVRGYRSVAA